MKNGIFIVGYPYVRPEYFATFLHYPEPDKLLFLLPCSWDIKKGRVIFQPSTDSRVRKTATFFSHSHYPIVGGIAKGWMPFFPFHLFRVRKNIDLVYSCTEPVLFSALYNALFTKLVRKKFVFFTWENIPLNKKFHGLNLLLKRLLMRIVIALSDGVICGNSEGAAILHTITSKPIAIIPMSGVDTEYFYPQTTKKQFKQYNWNNKVVFTFAGSISYRKGLGELLEAFKKLIRDVPDAHLVLAGSGEYEEKLIQKIEDEGLHDFCTRIPWLDRSGLRDLFAVSDVFVYPSIPSAGWEEQFGYSMAEASAMALPIISTKSGSIHHIVIDGNTGLLVPPKDITTLYEAMKELGTGDELRRKMGASGRQYVQTNFSELVIAKRFYDFFKYFAM